MKSNLSLCILIIVMLSSCKKTSNIDVTVSTSGRLTYRLLDDAGKGLANVNVALFDMANSSNNSGILLDTRKTNDNGLADFGDLNPITYKVVPESPMVNNVAYSISDYVQVLTGKTIQRDVKVSEYSGVFNVVVSNYSTQAPMKNVGVIVVPENKYIYNNNAAEMFKVVDFKGVTDNHGKLSFKVPSGKNYVIATYDVISNEISNAAHGVSVNKDGTVDLELSIYTW